MECFNKNMGQSINNISLEEVMQYISPQLRQQSVCRWQTKYDVFWKNLLVAKQSKMPTMYTLLPALKQFILSRWFDAILHLHIFSLTLEYFFNGGRSSQKRLPCNGLMASHPNFNKMINVDYTLKGMLREKQLFMDGSFTVSDIIIQTWAPEKIKIIA